MSDAENSCQDDDVILESNLNKKNRKRKLLTELLEDDLNKLNDCPEEELEGVAGKLSLNDLKLISKNLKLSYTGKDCSQIFKSDLQILKKNSDDLLNVFDKFRVPKNKASAVNFLKELKAIDRGKALRTLSKYVN